MGRQNTIYQFIGPSHTVQNVASAALGLGQILPIPPPAANASWVLEFWGPALHCSDVLGTKRNAIWRNIWNAFNSSNPLNGGQPTYPLLAWVPWSVVDQPSYFPDENETFDADLPFYRKDGYPILSSSTMALNTSATLFLAIMPEMLSFSLTGIQVEVDAPNATTLTFCDYKNASTVQDLNTTLSDCGPMPWQASAAFQQATLLRCDLASTSYSAAFRYVNGTQSIQISTNTTEQSPLVTPAYTVLGPEIPDDLNFNHTYSPPSIQNATAGRPKNCSTLLSDKQAHENLDKDCIFDPAVAQLLSY